MNKKKSYLILPVVTVMNMIASVLVAQEQNSTPSASEQKAMTVLKNMSQYLAQAERFSVTIRDGYDAVQRSGQKVEYGEVRKVTISRPDRLRFEIERSDGEKGLVLFNGKDLTVFTADKNVYATASKQGTLDQIIKYALDDLKIRVPLVMMLLSTLPSELDNLVVTRPHSTGNRTSSAKPEGSRLLLSIRPTPRRFSSPKTGTSRLYQGRRRARPLYRDFPWT
jgi:hypothetical protein